MSTVLESINSGLHRALNTDRRVVLLGEDILDPYGGAFKATRGLSSAFPDRVLSTPISEAGVVGVASGMALRGLRPVVEIMFGDFLTLAADQLVNHAAKFQWMYNDQVQLPMVVRTPMGGRRGYGPTHSQTLEKIFLGVPGLRVVAPSVFGDPGDLLYQLIFENTGPVLFIENKLLYLLPLHSPDNAEIDVSEYRPGQPAEPFTPPAYKVVLRGAPAPTLTLAAYGYMAELARQAMLRLAYEHEIFCELVVETQISPYRPAAWIDSIRRTGRLLSVEEGTLTLGWGAEVLARAAETLGPRLMAASRVAALETPVPASGPLENATLPGVNQIIQAAAVLSSR